MRNESGADAASIALVAVGGAVIAATGPEMILTARLALAGCKSNPVLCLNQAGIYAADIAVPEAAVGTGSLLAGSTILVGKSQEEAVQFGRQQPRPVIC